MDANYGLHTATAFKAGLIQAMAEAQYPVTDTGISSATPWYQFVLDSPILTITIATILAMAIVHIVTVFVCRRYKVNTQLPLASLWISFATSVGIGLLRLLPQLGIPMLVVVGFFLITTLMREFGTKLTNK
jgi:hypothetical protein